MNKVCTQFEKKKIKKFQSNGKGGLLQNQTNQFDIKTESVLNKNRKK